jgi:hypothetical protein
MRDPARLRRGASTVTGIVTGTRTHIGTGGSGGKAGGMTGSTHHIECL